MNYVPLTTESKKGLMCNKDMEPYYICTLVHIFASWAQAVRTIHHRLINNNANRQRTERHFGQM